MEDLIESLKILSTYLSKDEYTYSYPTNCEHDELRVCVEHYRISQEDLARLKELGFVPDAENTGYMVSYRFGSN